MPQDSTSGRLQTNKAYQTRYDTQVGEQVARRFVSIAEREGVPPAALAVAWVAAHPAVTAPLIGARNVTQLEQSLRAGDLTLTPDLYEELSALSQRPPPANDRQDDGTEHDLYRR